MRLQAKGSGVAKGSEGELGLARAVATRKQRRMKLYTETRGTPVISKGGSLQCKSVSLH